MVKLGDIIFVTVPKDPGWCVYITTHSFGMDQNPNISLIYGNDVLPTNWARSSISLLSPYLKGYL